MPTFGSLFAGIGGIDLGLERAGWTGRWQVEIDEYCSRVLAKHWPDIPRYGDITTVDWSGVEPVDLLAGGFPCQPISSAGSQKAQGDERWLWPEFLRAIRALRPRLVLVENVTNLLAINDGSAFGEVVGGLAESGYDAEWDCIPAAAVGALHERDRVWIVAYANRDGRDPASEWQGGPEGSPFGPALAPREHRSVDGGRSVRGAGAALADPDGIGLPRPRQLVEPIHSEALADWKVDRTLDGGRWPAEPAVGRLVDGVPDGLARRRESALRGLGNAVVPQVVEVIGRRLLEVMEAAA